MTHRGPFQPLLFCDSVIGKRQVNCETSKMLWVNPGRQLTTREPPTHSHPQWDRGRRKKSRSKELGDQAKNCLISETEVEEESKKTKTKQAMQRQSLTTAHGVDRCPTSSWAKTANLTKTPSLPFLLLSRTLLGMEYLICWFRLSDWLCQTALSTSCPLPSYSLWEQNEKEIRPWRCSATAKTSVH